MNKIIFTLSPEEVKQALYTARVLKPYKTRVIVVAIISIILCATTFRYDESSTYFIPVALLVANLFLGFGHKKNEENTVKGSTTGEEMVLTLYENYINVVVQAYDADWNILIDDVMNVLEDELLIIITLKDNRLIAIPKRILNDTNKPDLQRVLNYFTNQEILKVETGE